MTDNVPTIASLREGLYEVYDDHEAVEEYLRKILAAERKRVLESLEDYICHTDRCILAQWQAGEPTADGGYRSKYGDKWYQTRPIDETPKCDCGLDEAFQKLRGRL